MVTSQLPPLYRLFLPGGDQKLCSQMAAKSRWEDIYKIVRRIPRGRVATYGQVATLAGLDGHARQVGYALHDLPPNSGVPWHRVINAKGEISPRSAGDWHELQRMLLEGEGVELDLAGRVDLRKYRWKRGSRAHGEGPGAKP